MVTQQAMCAIDDLNQQPNDNEQPNDNPIPNQNQQLNHYDLVNFLNVNWLNRAQRAQRSRRVFGRSVIKTAGLNSKRIHPDETK